MCRLPYALACANQLTPEMRDMNHTTQESIEREWKKKADAKRENATGLAHGKERDDSLKSARQFDTASHMNDWLF